MNEINNEAQVNKAMDLATNTVTKKVGFKTGIGLALVTLVIGAGYAAAKGVLALIEAKENQAFEATGEEEEAPVDADFEPVE